MVCQNSLGFPLHLWSSLGTSTATCVTLLLHHCQIQKNLTESLWDSLWEFMERGCLVCFSNSGTRLHHPTCFLTNQGSHPVLVSGGCRSKLPWIGWFKTIEMYSLTILEARSSKSRYQQATLPPKVLGKNPSFLLPASGGSRCPLACDNITLISASVITWPSLPLAVFSSSLFFFLSAAPIAYGHSQARD